MPILDAALAFALTMLLVATVVTWCVNLIRLWTKARAKDFSTMMKEYASSELDVVIKRGFEEVEAKLQAHAPEELRLRVAELAKRGVPSEEQLRLLNELLANPELQKVAGVDGMDVQGAMDELTSLRDTLANAERWAGKTALSTEELLDHVRHSDFGRKVTRQLGEHAEGVFEALGKRFELVGDKFTIAFRGRSRLLATVVAFGVALVFNIDSLFMLDSYLSNDGMRAGVVAQMDVIANDYERAIAATPASDSEVTPAQLKQALSDTQAELDRLSVSGLPLGFSYFPHVVYLFDESSPAQQSRDTPLGWVTWAVGIVLTALLAGLGGPFWYDAVSRISRVAQAARGGRASDKKGQTPA